MLGRQAGYFLIVACQRPDAKYFSDGVRDNFNFRVGLGRILSLIHILTIVDTIKLDGLTKGTKYQLKGWQMLKEENAELIIDGKRVENDYTFVADDEEMLSLIHI